MQNQPIFQLVRESDRFRLLYDNGSCSWDYNESVRDMFNHWMNEHKLDDGDQFKNIKNFRSYKGKMNAKCINDLVIEENKILDQIKELNDKLDLINDIIRMKENETNDLLRKC